MLYSHWLSKIINGHHKPISPSTQKCKKNKPDLELSSRGREIFEEPTPCVKSNVNAPKYFHNFFSGSRNLSIKIQHMFW